MSGSGREVLPDVQEWSRILPDVRECSGGPPVCPVVVGRSSRMSESGREPSQMSGSGQDALPDVRMARPMPRSVREALPYVR